jgi:hypothetical protein
VTAARAARPDNLDIARRERANLLEVVRLHRGMPTLDDLEREELHMRGYVYRRPCAVYAGAAGFA